MIDVCPHCNKPKIYQRKHYGGNPLDHHQYRCGNCQQSFDEPEQRERQHDGGAKAETILARVTGGNDD